MESANLREVTSLLSSMEAAWDGRDKISFTNALASMFTFTTYNIIDGSQLG